MKRREDCKKKPTAARLHRSCGRLAGTQTMNPDQLGIDIAISDCPCMQRRIIASRPPPPLRD